MEAKLQRMNWAEIKFKTIVQANKKPAYIDAGFIIQVIYLIKNTCYH